MKTLNAQKAVDMLRDPKTSFYLQTRIEDAMKRPDFQEVLEKLNSLFEEV